MKKVIFTTLNAQAALKNVTQEKYYGVQGKTYKQFVTRQEPECGRFTTRLFNQITRGDALIGRIYESTLQDLLVEHLKAGDLVFEFDKYEDLLLWGAGRSDYKGRLVGLEPNEVHYQNADTQKFYGALNKTSYKGVKGLVSRRFFDKGDYIIVAQHTAVTNGNNWSFQKECSLSEFIKDYSSCFEFFEFETPQELFKWIAE